MEDEGKLRLDMNYNSDLFAKETILRMGTHFEEVLKSILSDSAHKIRNVNILSTAEKQQILSDFNNTQAAYPKDKTLVDLFEEQVISTPDNIAVIFEEKQLTYKELNEAANRLAHYLRDNYQIKPGRRDDEPQRRTHCLLAGNFESRRRVSAHRPGISQ